MQCRQSAKPVAQYGPNEKLYQRRKSPSGMAQRVKTGPAATGLTNLLRPISLHRDAIRFMYFNLTERGAVGRCSWLQLRLSYQYLSICLLSDRHQVRMTPGRRQGVISQSLLADCYVCLYWNVVSAPDVAMINFYLKHVLLFGAVIKISGVYC